MNSSSLSTLSATGSPPTRIGAAVAGELLVDDALVAVLGVEAVGLDELDVVDVGEQGQEQHEAGDGEVADRPVHVSFTTWVSSSRSKVEISGRGTARLVADAQQQGDDRPVHDHRRPALRHERRGQTGQRDEPGDAADDDEHLEGEREREAGGEQLAERVAAGEGDAQAALDDESVDQEDRHQAGQPELLAHATRR